MRTYEFTPYTDAESTVFAIKIEEAQHNKTKISTFWSDFGRHLSKNKKELTESEVEKCKTFKQQLSKFWKTVCRIESKYNAGMIEDIIASISDPDLKEFLVQNS